MGMHHTFRGRWRSGVVVLPFLLCFPVLSTMMRALQAAHHLSQGQVAKAVSETATLARRVSADQPWHVVQEGDVLPADQVLVGMHGAALDSANGAVRLRMFTDLDGQAPYPVVESAVVLHDNPKVDLDFTLDRGRVDLVNRKGEGPAHVRVRVRKATWELTLEKPGTRLALLLYGRWPRGTTFNPKPGPADVPTADLVLLVMHGEMNLAHGGFEYALTSPPGPALMEWDSVGGEDRSPTHLDKLPAWANVERAASPAAKARQARQARLRAMVRDKGLQAALQAIIHSDDADDRRAAVNAMAALDDLKDLGAAMRDGTHPDVLDDGILALRRWLGRGPGQDQLLYQKLIAVRHLSPVHAATVIQLLHSFGDEDLMRPETYQMLINYLGHSDLAIRALAYWHLSRLVPAGKKLGYHPQAPRAEREAAIRQWQQLVPPGKVPARTTARRKQP